MKAARDNASNVIELVSTEKSEEEELVEQGFEAIYDACVPYVASIGHKLLGRPEEVEDLVQDVFVTVYRHLPKLKEPAALRGWLATITTRKAMRRLKKRKLQRFVGFDDYHGYESAQYDGMTAEQRILLRQVFAKLDELPSRWRVIWTLRYLEGKNNLEIAEMVGCSRSTVKRDLSSAQALLREVFDGE